MRFPRPILLVVSACLALAFLPASANAGPRDAGRAGSSGTSGISHSPRTERAEEVLAAVQAAFSGDSSPGRRGTVDGRDVTLLLAELRTRLDDLAPIDRRIARTFLARPTDGNDPFVRYPRDARPTSDCQVAPTKGSKVCVHWTRRSGHAPPAADTDGDGLPNQVEKTRNVTNHVWERIVTDGGYRRPPRDNKGPNRKLDVYLANIGSLGLYGYCVTEDRVSGRAYTGYCVVDDDYSRSEFPTHTANQNLKVTVAHEFFHAVQFGYDAEEATWFMEGSAAWIEDEIYDAVDDNHLYLPFSPLARPQQPLDNGSTSGLSIYGSWIFWRFLTERYPGEGGTGLPKLMRRMWEDADHVNAEAPRFQAMGALRRELDRHGAELPSTYADFAAANRHPESARQDGRPVYEEGEAYQRFVGPPTTQHTLRQAAPDAGGSPAVDHLASASARVLPAATLGTGRTLRLTADRGALGADAEARAVVFPTSGPVRSVPATLTADGWRFEVTGFDTGTVRYVELVLVNGKRSGGRVAMPYQATVLPAP